MTAIICAELSSHEQINRVVSHPTLPLTITAHEDHHLRFFDNNTGTLLSVLMLLVGRIKGHLSCKMSCSSQLPKGKSWLWRPSVTGHRLLASLWKCEVLPDEVLQTRDSLGPRDIHVPPLCHHRCAMAANRLEETPRDWEQLMRMFTLKTLGTIHHGRRDERGILGNESSVRQRSDRSSPLRKNLRKLTEHHYPVTP